MRWEAFDSNNHIPFLVLWLGYMSKVWYFNLMALLRIGICYERLPYSANICSYDCLLMGQ